jgi:hypothetical protein
MADRTELTRQQASGETFRFKDMGDGTYAEVLTVVQQPIPYGTLGHYRVSYAFLLANTQAANSRLFTMRNNGGNLIVPTRLIIKWLLTGAHTAAILDTLALFKCTGFTVSDTVNIVTPAPSRKRTTMAAAPGGAEIRGVTAAGAAAGMTGGTLTKDASAFAQLPQWLLAALPTAAMVPDVRLDAFDDLNGTHPFAFAQNEGFELENTTLLGAAASSAVYVDFSWAEVTASAY